MINRLAVRWANLVVKSNGEEERRYIYIYGAECLLGEVISDAILLLFAVCLSSGREMLLWIFTFNILRLNVGGYHAKTPMKCMIFSILLGIGNILIIPQVMKSNIFITIIIIVCAVLIFIIAPVSSTRHPISEQRRNNAKIKSRYLTIVLCVLIFILKIILKDANALVMALALCSVSILGGLGYLESKRQ